MTTKTLIAMKELPLFETDFETTEAGQYDKEHPDIWTEFERIALNLIDRSIKHYGAKAVFEIIRYWRTINKIEGEEFKCNNNYTAYYARKFAQKYPEYAGFFEIRNGSKER